MIIQVGDERISPWLIGGGLGLVAVGAIGLLAERLGFGLSVRAFVFLFVLWRGALLTAINAAAECKSYTCPEWLKYKVVDSAEAWKIVTDELARVGVVSRKVTGKATEALLEREEAIRLLCRQLLSFPAQDPPAVRLPRPPAPMINSPESHPHAESA